MINFLDREKAFESQFAYDQETKFKIKAIRNHILAEWVAKKVNFNENDKLALIKEYIDLTITQKGHESLAQNIKQKFDENNINYSLEEIFEKIFAFYREAHERMNINDFSKDS